MPLLLGNEGHQASVGHGELAFELGRTIVGFGAATGLPTVANQAFDEVELGDLHDFAEVRPRPPDDQLQHTDGRGRLADLL